MVKYDGQSARRGAPSGPFPGRLPGEQRVPPSAVTGFSDVVATLAAKVAPRIAGDIVFQHGKFRVPSRRGGMGTPVPGAVLVAAVTAELPGGLDPYQREYIARAVVEHPAFRLALEGHTPNRDTCSEDGCEGLHYARGWCRSHYRKWYRAQAH